MNSAIKTSGIENLPYWTSPALIFTFQQTAALAGGLYTFGGSGAARVAFNPPRPIQGNVVYFFRTLSFAMDVSEQDFLGAVSSPLSFSVYLRSDGGSPSLREPIPLPKYHQNLDYRFLVHGPDVLNDAVNTIQGFQGNSLLGLVNGVVTQTVNLAGKASLTATIVIAAQEIKDNAFIASMKQDARKGGF